MTNNYSVKVKEISKRFVINPTGQLGTTTFRDWITSRLINSARKKLYHQALSNVSFNLNPGDRLGVIGPNGAGKTTLLKILANITYANSGNFCLNGKTSSLLEVGTAFHPELTGQENIYLNGSILGMSKTQIKNEFNQIVNFAEIGEYLNVPLKRYSTGMQMRLGFAVAAFMKSDILLIDEVLAVGDEEFQRRCLAKMEELSNQGRTIIFVSHNFALIEKFCNKGLLLVGGKVKYFGTVTKAIASYRRQTLATYGSKWINRNVNDTKQPVYLDGITITDDSDHPKTEFTNTESIKISLTLKVKQATRQVKVGFDLWKNGQIVLRSQQIDTPLSSDFSTGLSVLSCRIPAKLLNAGEYFISPLLSRHCIDNLIDQTQPIIGFKVVIDPSGSPFHSILNENNNPGFIFPLLKWQNTVAK